METIKETAPIIDLRKEYQRLQAEYSEAVKESDEAREALDDAEANEDDAKRRLEEFTSKHGRFDIKEVEMDNSLPTVPWMAGYHLLPQAIITNPALPDLFGAHHTQRSSFTDLIDAQNRVVDRLPANPSLTDVMEAFR